MENHITIFAGVKFGEKIALFKNKERVLCNKETIAKEIFNLRIGQKVTDEKRKELKLQYWSTLENEKKKKAVNNTNFENIEESQLTVEEIRDFLIYSIDNGLGLDDCYLDKIWESQLTFIYEHADEVFGVFKASGCNGVYAIKEGQESIPLKTWVDSLKKMAEAISPQAEIVNLVVHNGDINEEDKYREENGINVIRFSHSTDFEPYNILCSEPEKVGDIHIRLKEYFDNKIRTKDSTHDPIGSAYENLIKGCGAKKMISKQQREHRILYFSVNDNHHSLFYKWAKLEIPAYCHLIEWEMEENTSALELSRLIAMQNDIDGLCVIIDYLSLKKGDDENDHMAANIIRRTILQFPEVFFLFDQSGVDENENSNALSFLLCGDSETISNVVMGFHVFDAGSKKPFFFAELDIDNLFDGTNLRWGVRMQYYKRLDFQCNFSKLQESRRDNLAWVVDDEPRQSRFNGYALFASGFRAVPIHTAHMLLALNGCLKDKPVDLLVPSIVVRDFDLQFPDVLEKYDYIKYEKEFTILDVPEIALENQDFGTKLRWKLVYIKEKKEPIVDSFNQMIDYVRGYYFDKKKKEWYLAHIDTLFWHISNDFPIYEITNGYNSMTFQQKGEYHGIHLSNDNKNIIVDGIQKPISGLYYPFFTKLRYTKDGKNIFIVESQHNKTVYKDDEKDFLLDKTRENHTGHGVPADVYDMAKEMIARADKYYDDEHYVKSAVLAQETIELLNGLHYQMMIKAYQVKSKAENAIAMDVIGADEEQLVRDAKLRVDMIKHDIHRMVYPLYIGEGGWFRDFKKQYECRKMENRLLGHIFSNCRRTCHNNEYYEVEAVFIREMAHIDHRDVGIKKELKRYLRHRKIIKELNKRNEKGT